MILAVLRAGLRCLRLAISTGVCFWLIWHPPYQTPSQCLSNQYFFYHHNIYHFQIYFLQNAVPISPTYWQSILLPSQEPKQLLSEEMSPLSCPVRPSRHVHVDDGVGPHHGHLDAARIEGNHLGNRESVVPQEASPWLSRVQLINIGLVFSQKLITAQRKV